MQYPLTCVECGAPARCIYREYSSSRHGRNIRLSRCVSRFTALQLRVFVLNQVVKNANKRPTTLASFAGGM